MEACKEIGPFVRHSLNHGLETSLSHRSVSGGHHQEREPLWASAPPRLRQVSHSRRVLSKVPFGAVGWRDSHRSYQAGFFASLVIPLISAFVIDLPFGKQPLAVGLTPYCPRL